MRRILTSLLFVLLVSLAFAKGTKEDITTVEIWHSNSGKSSDIFEEIVDAFNSTVGKEKNIFIDSIYQGKANDVLTKVKAASSSGNLPDIAQMDATSGMDMNRSSYIVTMDELGVDSDDILENAKTGFTSERGLIAMPFNGSVNLLYYNKDIFDELGLDAPKTLDDMIRIAPLLKSKATYAFAGVPTTSELTTLLGAQNGLEYMTDNQNGHIGNATKVLFGENGSYKKFLEKWKALYDTGAVNNLTQSVMAEFASARTAMMISSSSDLTTILSQVANSFDVAVAPIPMVDEKATAGLVVGGAALYAFTKSDAVKTVIEYLLSSDVQLKWAKETGYIPLNTELYKTDKYKEFISEDTNFKIIMDAVFSSNPRLTNVWLPSAYQIYYTFQKNIVDVITGSITIDEGVEEMTNFVQRALDENNK